jgi:diguanylate cyclase (GGDEF)-like protein/PAS domain S-box-containing protein
MADHERDPTPDAKFGETLTASAHVPGDGPGNIPGNVPGDVPVDGAPTAGAGHPIDEIAALTVSLEDGSLAQHPGPALLLEKGGGVLAHNLSATSIAFNYRHDGLPGLTTMVDAVSSGAGPQTFKLDDPDIASTLDFALMPVADGRGVLVLGRDVSLDQNLRSALIDSRQRYKDLTEISSDFAWETGEKGQFVFVSAAGALGYETDDLVGRASDEFLASDRTMAMFNPFMTQEPVQAVEVRFRRYDGQTAILEAAAAPLHDVDGKWRGARGVCRDVTEARKRDAALNKARNRERLTAFIVDAIRDEIEPDQMLAAAAQSAQRALDADGVALFQIVPGSGLTESQSIGEALDAALMEEARELVTNQRSAVVVENDNGSVLAHQLSYHKEMNGAVMLWRRSNRGAWDDEERSLLSDLSGQFGIAIRQAEAHNHLRVLSSTDAMTGLMNRRSFNEALSARLDDAGDGRTGVLVYVDLDNFKLVNDVRGHQTGDQALIHLARLLKDQAGPEDLVARLGGDEFALWLENETTDTVGARAERILEDGKALREYSGSPEKQVGLSIGMAVREAGSGESMEALIERADGVMYEIKHGGKGWYRIAASAIEGGPKVGPESGPEVGPESGAEVGAEADRADGVEKHR